MGKRGHRFILSRRNYWPGGVLYQVDSDDYRHEEGGNLSFGQALELIVSAQECLLMQEDDTEWKRWSPEHP